LTQSMMLGATDLFQTRRLSQEIIYAHNFAAFAVFTCKTGGERNDAGPVCTLQRLKKCLGSIGGIKLRARQAAVL